MNQCDFCKKGPCNNPENCSWNKSKRCGTAFLYYMRAAVCEEQGLPLDNDKIYIRRNVLYINWGKH